ncbi:MBL fold metallo-hydrolase [Paenibacillus sp. SC116]|uniref:MBL fold metallo-hydrolase n=1 Tax=Paenibacillus sp. SC116 TaxID=2968986 RepID=UPI00215AF3D5|nr:MBL fold metallo-hydrolase [Paenibacillus sp. SC116]MCR8845867.1 MBL fold metallo-hydrolase [Paenibacillus sp. SC116]
MKAAKNVEIEMLTLSASMMGKVETIYPTLLWDEKNLLLVDAGYPGQLPLLEEALRKLGKSTKQITNIIITHQDMDHIGSLPDIVKESELDIEVLSSPVEMPYIQGDKTLLKLTPEAIKQAEASLPPQLPEQWRSAFLFLLNNPPRAHVHRTLQDGEQLSYCGGLTVIPTPGHTPGHISLYHQSSKTLIAGDAMVVAEGQLFGPDAMHTLDLRTAYNSLHQLAQYDIDTVICYHGGMYTGDANQRIAELTRENTP